MSAAPRRRVLIPSRLQPAALRGAGSGRPIGRCSGEAMGTGWTLHFQLDPEIPEDAVATAVDDAFALVVAQMSHWDPDSELGRFNRADAGGRQRISPEFRHVLERAIGIAEQSGGACDPTLGELVDLHGFGPATPDAALPDDDTLDQVHAHSGWRRIELDSDLLRQPGGLRLDLSSIAKGYAVDLAARALESLGLRDFLLELGGELVGRGCKPDGQPWWVTLDTPTGLPETLVALCGLALATSGDTVRRRRIDGREFGHLLDPATGRPTAAKLSAVSVIAEHCIDADAWATALFVAGPERGPQLAEDHDLAALFTLRGAIAPRQLLSPAALAMAS